MFPIAMVHKPIFWEDVSKFAQCFAVHLLIYFYKIGSTNQPNNHFFCHFLHKGFHLGSYHLKRNGTSRFMQLYNCPLLCRLQARLKANTLPFPLGWYYDFLFSTHSLKYWGRCILTNQSVPGFDWLMRFYTININYRGREILSVWKW